MRKINRPRRDDEEWIFMPRGMPSHAVMIMLDHQLREQYGLTLIECNDSSSGYSVAIVQDELPLEPND